MSVWKYKVKKCPDQATHHNIKGTVYVSILKSLILKSLPLIILDMHHLQESIIFEWLVGSKTCKFVSLYWFPSQTNNVFEKFADNLELTLTL